ncbi:hypothetical protein [Coraliomargarita akajimensis]|uniref:Uncharacterized protein n=1 Tax=Coraliomargarita akajimensis (strain DSM 45221 / IAM 15411 / JCM 23193 / KCTC 12865 / 04OKA010-24) TaxID=583355 RepID=D5ER56_CORAD|nr:hypothetical protein [Coraliomargarita akajimensis]ADE55900.1 hypothetical protein Caka_2887 [Coraliomargarita akajimensis DSM 45221]
MTTHPIITAACALALLFMVGGCASFYKPEVKDPAQLCEISGSSLKDEAIFLGSVAVHLINNQQAHSTLHLGKTTAPVKIDAGTHDLLIHARYTRSFFSASYEAYLPITATFAEGGRYMVKGKVTNDSVHAWIEDRSANQRISEVVTTQSTVVPVEPVVPVYH